MMELSKLCKHSKLRGYVVFVGLEKEHQIGHTQPKSNFVKKVLVNPRKVICRKAGTLRFTHFPAVQLLWLAEEDYSYASYLV